MADNFPCALDDRRHIDGWRISAHMYLRMLLPRMLLPRMLLPRMLVPCRPSYMQARTPAPSSFRDDYPLFASMLSSNERHLTESHISRERRTDLADNARA